MQTGALEQWEGFVKERYRRDRKQDEFRVFDDSSPEVVKQFYRENHARQTREFVLAKKREYTALNKARMSVWEAMEKLEAMVDDSDPDTDLTQIEHNIQTAEALRRAGYPRWMVLTGLIHDLGKVLCLYGEPQWAIGGDTFPVGCAWSDKIVFAEYFAANPDREVAAYQTLCGVYEPHCGLERVDMSWGHDEYLYWVMRDYLPEEALYIIRYHSFYPQHRERAYDHLLNEKDQRMLEWVRRFNPFDLYSKSDERPALAEVRPYYEELVAEYLPGKLRW
jgi:inositol oxygenase